MYTCAYCCSSIVIVLGLAEHSQHMTETPKQRLRVRQSEAKWTQVWESGVRPQSMSSSTKGAKGRASWMKWKDRDSEVATLCYFGARRKLQHFTDVRANFSRAHFYTLCSCLSMSQDLSSSVLDCAHLVGVRLTLCVYVDVTIIVYTLLLKWEG